MPIYFLDSSALVKRYVREAGTGWVSTLFPSGRVTVAAISAAEVAAAISRARGLGRFQQGKRLMQFEICDPISIPITRAWKSPGRSSNGRWKPPSATV